VPPAPVESAVPPAPVGRAAPAAAVVPDDSPLAAAGADAPARPTPGAVPTAAVASPGLPAASAPASAASEAAPAPAPASPQPVSHGAPAPDTPAGWPVTRAPDPAPASPSAPPAPRSVGTGRSSARPHDGAPTPTDTGSWSAAPPPRTDPPAPPRPAVPEPSGPRAPSGRPALPWPDTAGGPRTIIDADDLKTAFFISDSAFGPLPAEGDDVPTRTRVPPAARPTPATPAAHRRADDPTTVARPENPPTVTRLENPPTVMRPEAPPTVLRPEVDPLAGFQTDPLPPPDAAAEAGTRVGSPLRDASLAAESGEPAIDYFAPRRGRSRSLGLALSPGAWAAAGVLSMLLLAQALLGWRDTIAARVPPLSPVLSAIGAPFGLGISPPREIGALTIESFELQAAPTPNLLQLTALLRNRRGHLVAFPAMELTLTDSAGSVLVRKVIVPDAYLPDAAVASRGLGERSEWPIRLALEHRGLQPTGYSVALFYP
jgi:hypothetical protein